MVTIQFEKTDGTYTFKDAIVLPDDHELTEEQIEVMKEERWNNWIALVTAVPEEE